MPSSDSARLRGQCPLPRSWPWPCTTRSTATTAGRRVLGLRGQGLLHRARHGAAAGRGARGEAGSRLERPWDGPPCSPCWRLGPVAAGWGGTCWRRPRAPSPRLWSTCTGTTIRPPGPPPPRRWPPSWRTAGPGSSRSRNPSRPSREPWSPTSSSTPFLPSPGAGTGTSG